MWGVDQSMVIDGTAALFVGVGSAVAVWGGLSSDLRYSR